MRKEYIKVSILILVFFIFYSVFGYINYTNYGIINNSQDFDFHWKKIQGLTTESYPALHHTIFSVFAFNELTYYLANIFLITIIIPLFLFKLNKNFWVVFIYFFAVNLPHVLIYGATYPQALILVFFLIYLNNRYNFKLLILLMILAKFTHKSGSILFFGILIFEFFYVTFGDLIKKSFNINGFLPAGYLLGTRLNDLRQFCSLIFLALPLPIIYFAFKKLKENAFYIFLVFFSFIAAIINDFRAISIAQIILISCASYGIKNKSKKIKIGFILFALIQFIYYFLVYILGTTRLITLS